MAFSMKKSLPGFGLDESNASMILRADSKVAAEQDGVFTFFGHIGSLIGEQRKGTAVYFFFHKSQNSLTLLAHARRIMPPFELCRVESRRSLP
jgi:hypothetical protein